MRLLDARSDFRAHRMVLEVGIPHWPALVIREDEEPLTLLTAELIAEAQTQWYGDDSP